MSCYLDTSVLVPLFLLDPLNARAEAFLQANCDVLLVSDFAIAEFSSVTARRVRAREITRREALQALQTFDDSVARSFRREDTTSEDVRAADRILRRLDLNLRTADAIHVAAARRLASTLVTFDRPMAASARRLGISVANA